MLFINTTSTIASRNYDVLIYTYIIYDVLSTFLQVALISLLD